MRRALYDAQRGNSALCKNVRVIAGEDRLRIFRFSAVMPVLRETYGSMYGMQKTTVYLPDDVKRALTHTAATRGISEAELIREAIRQLTSRSVPPRPRLPLFKSGKPRLAERVDEVMTGFGER